jgi:hypothetical protein
MTDAGLFAWFDALGFPDVSRHPYVRVATGLGFQHGSDPPQNRYAPALLLEDAGDRFRVFTIDLSEHSFTPTAAGTPEHQRVGYERADLAADVAAYLAAIVAADTQPLGGAARYFGAALGLAADGFVLARLCAAHGLPEASAQLLDRAAQDHAADRRHHVPFAQQVSDEIAHMLLWRAVQSCADPTVGRPDLLARFESILRHFPAPEPGPESDAAGAIWAVGVHGLMAREAVEVLRLMIAEDEEHARRPAVPFAELSRDEQIAELIFLLRDQQGRQFSDPGACSPFRDPRGEESPAHRLVGYGFDAVPQLMAALTDRRFTRSIGWHRSYYFSHYLLRVGDCALAVLERIAGRSVWQRRSTYSAMVKDGDAAATKERTEAWWRQVRGEGEAAALAEVVRAGGRESLDAAGTLAERFPAVALAAIREGLGRATEEHVRAGLVERAGKVPGDEPLVFLREHLETGPLIVRVTAAQALRTRGEDVVPVMIAAWRGTQEGAELVGFLATSRRVEAVRVLADGLDERPVFLRDAVINAFDGFAWWIDKTPVPPEVAAAIDDLLADRLRDREVIWGMSGTFYGKSATDPRLCDRAAHHLVRRWDQPDLFDLEAMPGVRDRQLVAVANVWRGRRGLAPLPEAPRRERLPPGREWEVVAVSLDAQTELPHPLRARVEGLAGRRLDAGEVHDLWLAGLRGLPDDSPGAELSIERDEDGTGAAVEYRLLRRRYPPSGRPTWAVNGWVMVGGRRTWGTMSGVAYRHGQTNEYWQEFETALGAGLSAPPDVAVSVRVRATTEQGWAAIAED